MHHCAALRDVEGFKLRAICDTDPARREQASREYGLRVCSDLGAVISDDAIDLVVFITPHHVHAPQTVEALSAGKHVVVEKAMCLTVREADEMIDSGARAGRMLTVHQNRREDRDVLTARSVLESGALGEVYRIESACNYHGPQDGWRARRAAGGGYLYDAGGHLADQLVQMAGSRVATVYADLQKRIWTDGMDTETYANVQVRFENGLTAELDIGGIMWFRKPRFLIMGEQGTFTATAHENFGEADCFLHDANGLTPVKSIESPSGVDQDPGRSDSILGSRCVGDCFVTVQAYVKMSMA